MQIIININGTNMDIEGLETFPLSIVKQVDSFAKLVNSGGGTIANVLRKLVLPATKNNTNAVNQFHIPNTDIGQVRGILPISVLLNGAEILNGACVLETAVRNGWHPNKLIFRVLSDGNDVWAALEGVDVRDVDMGSIVWNIDNIINSQTGIPPTWGAIFAPIVYGQVTGQNSILPPPAATPAPKRKQFHRYDFRPSVFYYTIIKSIFASVGYAVVSDFIESDYFKRWLWLYGAGQDWKNSHDIELFKFHERLGTPQPIPANIGLVDVELTQEIYDPSGIYNNTTFLATAPVSGYYRLEYMVRCDNLFGVELSVTNVNPTDPDFDDVVFPSYSISDVVLRNYIKIGAGAQIRLRAALVPSAAETITEAYLKMHLTDEVVFRGDVAISSCLQSTSTKDFCRAISHQFGGLNFLFDSALKQVLILPRFDVVVKNNLNEDELIKGYYNNPVDVTPVNFEVDGRSMELSINDSYGESLLMGYKEDDDPVYKYTQRLSSQDLVYNALIELNKRGKAGAKNLNPVFTNLISARSNTVGTGVGEHYLPFVLPSGFEIEGTLFSTFSGNTIGELPPPDETTFESAPKCGIAYYPPHGTVVEFESYIPAPPAFDFIMPACFIQQGALIHQNSTIQFVQPIANGAYGDLLGFLNNSPATISKGLVSAFYTQYFAIIRRGEYLKALAKLSAAGVVAEDFRKIKKIKIGGNEQYWILFKLDGFKPTKRELTSTELVSYVSPTQEDIDSVEHYDPEIKPFTHTNLEI